MLRFGYHQSGRQRLTDSRGLIMHYSSLFMWCVQRVYYARLAGPLSGPGESFTRASPSSLSSFLHGTSTAVMTSTRRILSANAGWSFTSALGRSASSQRSSFLSLPPLSTRSVYRRFNSGVLPHSLWSSFCCTSRREGPLLRHSSTFARAGRGSRSTLASSRTDPLPSTAATPSGSPATPHPLPWAPLTTSPETTSAVLQEFGPGLPRQRPKERRHAVVYAVEPHGRVGSFRRYLFQTLVPSERRVLLAGAGLGLLLYVGGTLCLPASFAALIDGASAGELPTGTSAQLVALFGLVFVGSALHQWSVATAGEALLARLRCRLYRSIWSHPAESVPQDTPSYPLRRGSEDAGSKSTSSSSSSSPSLPPTASLEDRLALDSHRVSHALSHELTGMVGNVMAAVGSAVMLFHVSPVLAVAFGGLAAPMLIFSGVYGRVFQSMEGRRAEASVAMRAVAHERLYWFHDIKLLRTEQQEEQWYAANVEQCRERTMRLRRWTAVYRSSLHLILYGATLCLFWAGSLLIAGQRLTPGGLLAFALYGAYGVGSAVRLTQRIAGLNTGYGAWLRVFNVIDPAEALTLPTGTRLPSAAHPSIRTPASTATTTTYHHNRMKEDLGQLNVAFHKVCFSVLPPGSKRKNRDGTTAMMEACSPALLTDVEIPELFPIIPPSGPSVTCVVSDSSASLSAMVQLLLQGYRPQSGFITVDGQPVNESESHSTAAAAVGSTTSMSTAAQLWSPERLRQWAAHLGPRPMVLTGSVEQNIAYRLEEHEWGKALDGWRRTAVVEAAMRAGIHSMITALPHGYATGLRGSAMIMPGGGNDARESGFVALSTGEGQLVALARALACSPVILVLDQITRSLDAESCERVVSSVERLVHRHRHASSVEGTAASLMTTPLAKGRSSSSARTRPRGILLCTQDPRLVALAQHVILLDGSAECGGRVVAQGSLEAVRGHDLFQRIMGGREVFTSNESISA